MGPTVREKLRAEVMSSYWEDLAAHHARGALLLVAAELDLLDVADATAGDDAGRVAAWLKSGRLRRPSESEAAALEADDSLRFQFVVVQPWVLAQALQ